MPPAVQIEISPRPPPRRSISLASVPRIRAPVAPNGWPTARLLPTTFSFVRSIEPSGLLEAEPLATEFGRLPGLQRAEHLRRKRLVDFVEVEVLQRQAARPRASARTA